LCDIVPNSKNKDDYDLDNNCHNKVIKLRIFERAQIILFLEPAQFVNTVSKTDCLRDVENECSLSGVVHETQVVFPDVADKGHIYCMLFIII
jgi:hypothetical protein